MTREPDRYEAKGEELACAYHTVRCPDRSTLARQIAAALRDEHREALELAAQEVEAAKSSDRFAATQAILARRIRALASPAAAHTAEPRDVVTGTARETYAGIDFTLGTTPVAPSLLPRVLAFLEAHGASDALGFAQARNLADELRRYIAEREAGEDPRALEIHAARMKALDEYEKSARKIGERIDAQKRIAKLEAAIRWACGEEDEFPTRQPGQGAYWWRTELRRRAALADGGE